MKYGLVTGAGGGLGKSVAMGLVKLGYTVYGIDLNVPAEEQDGIKYFKADITNREQIQSMLAGGTKGAKDPEVLTKVVMKAVKAKKPKRVYKCNHDIKVKMLSKMPAGFGDWVFKLFG